MERLSRLTMMATLLMLGLNRWSHATHYRAFRVDANVQVHLTCWELTDANHLVLWMTPAEDIIGPDYQSESNKYTIDFDGSLIVNVSDYPILGGTRRPYFRINRSHMSRRT